MKIVSLSTNNFKRIVAVEIRPDGNLVEINGRNRQGKSSLLDSILAGLAGGRNIPMEPIRHGCEEGVIKIALGNSATEIAFKVTRTFKLKEGGKFTTNLTVKNADGATMPGPQDVLSALIGSIALDPVTFEQMKPDEQFDTVKHLVPGVDFAALAAADKADFEERTVWNRKAKEFEAQAEGIVLPGGKTPERVDVAALEQRLADASNHNSTLERRKAQRQAVMVRCEERTRRMQEMRDAIAEMESQQQTDVDLLKNAEALPDPIDVGLVQGALCNARQTNAIADRADQKKALTAKALEAAKASTDLTKRMMDREMERMKAIAKAKLPVEGMGFGDGFLTLDGAPFSQGSQEQRLSAAVRLAAALNPKLRIITIREGSRLDEDAMQALATFADENDMQIWCEKVGKGPSGFTIEDGYIDGEQPVEDIEEEAV